MTEGAGSQCAVPCHMRKFALAQFPAARETLPMSMSVKDKARTYRELGKLLKASFPMDKAVTLLLGQQASGPRHAFLLGISTGFAHQLSFAQAMRQNNHGIASEMELSLIESGERSGRLAAACEHLAHYFETWHKGIREARGAMLYPLILLHVGVLLPEVSRYMLLSNLPGQEAAANGVVPAVLLRLGIFWAGLVALWLVWRAMSKAATTSETADRILNMVPLISAVRRHWALARFCQVFHSTLLAAMRITDCLHMAGEAAQSGTLRNGARRAADEVKLDSTLAEGMARSKRFPTVFTNSIATAEAAGGLDHEFARWAQAETDLASESQRSAAEWYPKILYFLIVGYIATRIIGFASDYFGALGDVDAWMK